LKITHSSPLKLQAWKEIKLMDDHRSCFCVLYHHHYPHNLMNIEPYL
jgi:hypothetical protein